MIVDEQVTAKIILLVTADAAFARRIISRLTGNGHAFQLPIAVSLAQARAQLHSLAEDAGAEPCAILFDESAAEESEWAAGVYELARAAHLVVVSDAARLDVLLRPAALSGPEAEFPGGYAREDLPTLLAAGVVDWLPKTDASVELAVALLKRIAGRATERSRESRPVRVPAVVQFEGETRDFSEVLRHEVNNPLTGILGNAELLLARRGRLPEAVVARLETIAALAVRLRETIRRLSDACDLREPRSPAAAAAPKPRPRLLR